MMKKMGNSKNNDPYAEDVKKSQHTAGYAVLNINRLKIK